MGQENWRQVKEIFAEALRQPPEVRPQFLDRVCRDDKNLRREVESLLSSLDSAEYFLESPAVGEVVDEVLKETLNFTKGEFLGHYEIIRKIGTGGMGDVYLANDSKLDRQVALKILHENLSLENQAKQRLLREARAVAKLDHPNICAIYEISETANHSFIVMQYVSGETLAEILSQQTLNVEKSIDFALQIAAALEEAHSHRIIHRDIKPSNIAVNEKGQVKVLDFGLAKFIEDEETAKKLSSSGAIMGTVPYMSPEQLRGKTLDASTDIFSFGVVFYEMLSGIAPFQYDSNAEAISAILNNEPDWTRIPPELKSIVQKCLTKDKTGRYQSAKYLVNDLRNVGAVSAKNDEMFSLNKSAKPKNRTPRYYFWKSSDNEEIPKTQKIRSRKNTQAEKIKLNYYAVFLFFAIIFLLTVAGIWFVRQFSDTSDSHSFDNLRSIKLVDWKTGAGSPYSDFKLSHDGKMIAYSSTQEGENEGIYIKQTTEGEDFRVTKDNWSNQTPIWSPDDQRLAFASFRAGQSGIYVCPALCGQSTLLKIIGEKVIFPRYWSKDGSMIYYETENQLFRLDLATLETTQVTNLASAKVLTRYFNLSPDENQIVYVEETEGQEDLWKVPLAGGVPVRLTNDKDIEIQPRWHPDGEKILYTVLRNNHYQINFVNVNGGIPEQVTRSESEFELIDISGDGTKLFYRSWKNNSDIWHINIANGEEFEIAGGTEYEFWSEVSPDGKSILYQSNSMPYPATSLSKSLIIIKALDNQSPQISLKGINPHWLPDSRRIAFIRFEKTARKYSFWIYNTINGEEKQVTDKPVMSPPTSILPFNRSYIGEFSWSPDSRQVIFLSKESKAYNILKLDLESSQTDNITKNDNPNLEFYSPKWSPDGNSTAYISLSKNEKPRWSVWLIVDEKPREIYSTTASLRLLGWSANDELLLETTDGVMHTSSLDVKLIKVFTNSNSQIVSTLNKVYANSMTLSADGKYVAYTSRQDGKDNIYTASTNNGITKKITVNANDRLYYGSPAWSPDSKTIFFDKQEEINTISMFENFR